MTTEAMEPAPSTARSLRGADIHEPPVVIDTQSDIPPSQQTSSRVPLFRVAQWMQRAAKGTIDMGPGATAIHAALLVAIAQYQGYNSLCEATAKTLGKAAFTSESAAREALAELVDGAWITRHDRRRDDNQWIEALYSLATEPGKPIPRRRRKVTPAGHDSATTTTEESLPPPPAPSGSLAHDDSAPVPPDGVPCTARRSALYRQTECPVPPEPNKKTIQKTKEEISEKTIAQARECARDDEDHASDESGALNLFQEAAQPPTPKAKRVKKPKADKPKQAHDNYAESYAAGITDASGEDYPPPTEEKHWLVKMAVYYAKRNGVALVGAELLAWFRQTASEYRRARAGSAQFEGGFSPRKCLAWLNAGRPTGYARPQDIRQQGAVAGSIGF